MDSLNNSTRTDPDRFPAATEKQFRFDGQKKKKQYDRCRFRFRRKRVKIGRIRDNYYRT